MNGLITTPKKHDITIILGDFNAKVEETVVDGCTGTFGLGDRNKISERLIEFCQNEEILMTNTAFKQPKKLLYTWKTPDDGHKNNIIRS